MNNPTDTPVITDPARAAVLLRAAFDFLSKIRNDEAIGTVAFYDAADCDGLCLMEDIATELDIDANSVPLFGRWKVDGDHPIGGRPLKNFTVQDAAERYRDELTAAGYENVTITPEP